jgi:hypothetical protein
LPANTETLADILARTHVALPVGLGWAASVAAKLQDMHRRDRRHGKVASQSVRVSRDGLELLQPKQDFWRECTPDRDVRGFGAMLYEIVTGMPAPEQAAEPIAPPTCNVGDGLDQIRAAAIRMALKCMGHVKAKVSMRQAAMEARLLWMQCRRIEARAKTAVTTLPVEEPAPTERWERVRSEVA